MQRLHKKPTSEPTVRDGSSPNAVQGMKSTRGPIWSRRDKRPTHTINIGAAHRQPQSLPRFILAQGKRADSGGCARDLPRRPEKDPEKRWRITKQQRDFCENHPTGALSVPEPTARPRLKSGSLFLAVW